jgi:hypothetical protein
MYPSTVVLIHPHRSLWLGTALLLCMAAPVEAVSTLFLDGTMAFTDATDQVQMDGVLTGAAGVVPAPMVADSQFHLAAAFLNVASNGGITTATFGTAPGAPDVEVIDGNDIVLLAGELQSLSAVGVNGVDRALITGQLAPTGGSLMAVFANPAGLMELQLDLSAPYRSGIFNRDFTGHVSGRLDSPESIAEPAPAVAAVVPEPTTWALMAVGLLGLRAGHRWTRRRDEMVF